jgi:SAM-dependent methyltransferase
MMALLIRFMLLTWGGIVVLFCVDGLFILPQFSLPYLHCPVKGSKTSLYTKATSAPISTGTITNTSHSVLYIGNLEWNVDTVEWSHRIRSLLVQTMDSDTSDYFTIEFRSTTSRQRDIGKHHGGSMLVTFPNATVATRSLNILIHLQHQMLQNLSNSTQPWLIPLRLQYHRPPSSAFPPLKEFSDEELILLKDRRHERAASYARRRSRVANATDIVILQLHTAMSYTWWNLTNDTSLNQGCISVLKADELDWSIVPSVIDPAQGGGLHGPSNTAATDMNGDGTLSNVLSDRASRKRAAVEAFLVVVRNGLVGAEEDKGDKCVPRIVADLGCGAGNLALPLSWWLNQPSGNNESALYRVLGVDLNKISLFRLSDRARLFTPNLNHTLVETLEMDLLGLATVVDKSDSPLKNCSAVVSLHACGAASDLAIESAVRHGLPFAVSPCCIGKLLNLRPGIDEIATKGPKLPLAFPTQRASAPTGTVSYPRSRLFMKLIAPESYRLLASAADYGVRSRSTTESDVDEWKRWRRSRQAKKIIEIDRLQWAFEQGYYVRILELPRIGPLYSKREVLLGALQGSTAAIRISKLAVLKT